MRKFFLALFLAVALSSVLIAAYAEENVGQQILEESLQKVEQSGAQTGNLQFYETAQKVAEGTWDWSVTGILNRLLDLFFSELSENMSALVRMIVIAVLAGILCNL